LLPCVVGGGPWTPDSGTPAPANGGRDFVSPADEHLVQEYVHELITNESGLVDPVQGAVVQVPEDTKRQSRT
jgi:hypothetical protein